MDTISAYKMQALVNATMKNMLNTCYGVPKSLERSSIKAATVAVNPIEKVIFNPPATIVFWKSGEKTVVQTRGDDEFNPEIGLAMAISKHYLCGIYGLKRYDGVFKKYASKEKVTTVETFGVDFYNKWNEAMRSVMGDTGLDKKETANDAD